MQNFKVLREHHGDKPYKRGDTRLADASEVAHLVRAGVLESAGTDENERVDEGAPLDNQPITDPVKSTVLESVGTDENEKVDEAAPLDNQPITEPENKAPKSKATEAK